MTWKRYVGIKAYSGFHVFATLVRVTVCVRQPMVPYASVISISDVSD